MAADLIFTNARVLTMDDAQPRAEALAITGNRITAVGTHAEVVALKGPATRIIDAGGRSLLPGFHEGHMHLFSGAAELTQLQLAGVSGLASLKSAIRGYAGKNPGLKLIMAQGADYTILGGKRVTRHDLDACVSDRPFIMFSPDHHTAWANTCALDAAGILHGLAVPPGNEVVMGADGLAEGELREMEAFRSVTALQGSSRARLGLDTGGEPDPEPTSAEWEEDLATISHGLDYCAGFGITSITNMDGNFYTLRLLEEVNRRQGLKARTTVPFHFKSHMQMAEMEKASEMSRRWQDDKLKSGFVKLFIDGVLDSGTAVMIDDYPEQPGWKGDPIFEPARFRQIIADADRRGLQVAVHAIGDGAVRLVLDAYEQAQRSNGRRDSRHRIEHIEVVRPEDMPRFAGLGVIASMQPPHPPGTMGLPLEPTLTKIGERLWPHAYAWRALRAAGARLVFASDWPVSPISPLASISASMCRPKWRDDLPDNRQTLMEALASYTRDSAFADFMEHQKGQLKPGILADCVLLNGDIEATDPAAIADMRVDLTVCDGTITHGSA